MLAFKQYVRVQTAQEQSSNQSCFWKAIIVLTKKSRHSTPQIYLDACSHSLIGMGTALVIKCTADFTSAYCLL